MPPMTIGLHHGIATIVEVAFRPGDAVDISAAVPAGASNADGVFVLLADGVGRFFRNNDDDLCFAPATGDVVRVHQDALVTAEVGEPLTIPTSGATITTSPVLQMIAPTALRITDTPDTKVFDGSLAAAFRRHILATRGEIEPPERADRAATLDIADR